MALALFRAFRSGDLTLRAMSLAYLTLLSLVPLLVVVFVLLKAFGVHEQLEPALFQALAPLGVNGQALARRIVAFVANIKVGVLGFSGIFFLFYAIISLVQKIEGSINAIWHITRNRSLARVFSDYLSVIMIGPILVFAALGLRASLSSNRVAQTVLSIEPFGTLLLAAGKVLPYVMVCGAFTFLYGFIPNTRVKVGAALAGGIFAGLLWFITGGLFAGFVVQSSNYSAIYSGFAGVVLSIIWIQLGWLIVLLGAQLAYFWQFPHAMAQPDPRPATQIRGDTLALAVMALISEAHQRRERPWTRDRMAERLAVHLAQLNPLLDMLIDKGLIAETRANPGVLLPVNDTATIGLPDVIAAVRGTRPVDMTLPQVAATIDTIDSATMAALAGRTVQSLNTTDH